jgi:hypothetical protein
VSPRCTAVRRRPWLPAALAVRAPR